VENALNTGSILLMITRKGDKEWHTQGKSNIFIVLVGPQ
jgi:hypothetical protein